MEEMDRKTGERKKKRIKKNWREEEDKTTEELERKEREKNKGRV